MDVVVLNNLEKRGIIEAEVASISHFLMSQFTPQFMKMAADLRDLLTKQLKEWQHDKNGEQQVAVAGEAASTPHHDMVAEMNDMEAVIASAMADEERAYSDIGEKQRLDETKRRSAVCNTPSPPPAFPRSSGSIPSHRNSIDEFLHDTLDESNPFDDYVFDQSTPVDLEAFIPFSGGNDDGVGRVVDTHAATPCSERDAEPRTSVAPSVCSSATSAIMLSVAQHQLDTLAKCASPTETRPV